MILYRPKLHKNCNCPFSFIISTFIVPNDEVKVGMHQGSGLSPLLFVIVMEAISREFRVALPWELLYADDLAVITETEEELIKRLRADCMNATQELSLLNSMS